MLKSARLQAQVGSSSANAEEDDYTAMADQRPPPLTEGACPAVTSAPGSSSSGAPRRPVARSKRRPKAKARGSKGRKKAFSAQAFALLQLNGPCRHCNVTQSPQWRKGTVDKPVLCNACGIRLRRYKHLDDVPVLPLPVRGAVSSEDSEGDEGMQDDDDADDQDQEEEQEEAAEQLAGPGSAQDSTAASDCDGQQEARRPSSPAHPCSGLAPDAPSRPGSPAAGAAPPFARLHQVFKGANGRLRRPPAGGPAAQLLVPQLLVPQLPQPAQGAALAAGARNAPQARTVRLAAAPAVAPVAASGRAARLKLKRPAASDDLVLPGAKVRVRDPQQRRQQQQQQRRNPAAGEQRGEPDAPARVATKDMDRQKSAADKRRSTAIGKAAATAADPAKRRPLIVTVRCLASATSSGGVLAEAVAPANSGSDGGGSGSTSASAGGASAASAITISRCRSKPRSGGGDPSLLQRYFPGAVGGPFPAGSLLPPPHGAAAAEAWDGSGELSDAPASPARFVPPCALDTETNLFLGLLGGGGYSYTGAELLCSPLGGCSPSSCDSPLLSSHLNLMRPGPLALQPGSPRAAHSVFACSPNFAFSPPGGGAFGPQPSGLFGCGASVGASPVLLSSPALMAGVMQPSLPSLQSVLEECAAFSLSEDGGPASGSSGGSTGVDDDCELPDFQQLQLLLQEEEGGGAAAAAPSSADDERPCEMGMPGSPCFGAPLREYQDQGAPLGGPELCGMELCGMFHDPEHGSLLGMQEAVLA